MECDYDIGDEVVCIDDRRTSPEAAWLFQNWPKKDKKYTVRGFTENNGIVLGVWLEELRNKPTNIRIRNEEWVQEPAFATWRFKKLDKLEKEELSDNERTEIQKQHEPSYIEWPEPGKFNIGQMHFITRYI